MIGSSQLNLGRIDNVALCNLRKNWNSNILNFKNYSKGCNLVQSRRFLWPSRSAILSLRASSAAQNQPLVYQKASNTATNTTVSPCFSILLFLWFEFFLIVIHELFVM